MPEKVREKLKDFDKLLFWEGIVESSGLIFGRLLSIFFKGVSKRLGTVCGILEERLIVVCRWSLC
jgi:hypothetical protein